MYIQKRLSAFTLVELIVTISILSILSVLAFINVRIYIIESKNTKVVNDLNSVSNSLRAFTTSWKTIFWFVKNNSSNIDNISLFWGTGLLNTQEYIAGDINYQALSTSQDKFLDPYERKSYKIGVINTFWRNVFELAGTYKNPDSGSQYTKIYGSYSPRNTEKDVGITYIDISEKYIELSIQDTWFFKIWDIISNGVDDYVVQTISKDSKIVFLDTVNGLNISDTLSLKMSESLWLIGSREDKNLPVYEWSSRLPY